jgi:hypothetical protein
MAIFSGIASFDLAEIESPPKPGGRVFLDAQEQKYAKECEGNA